MLRGRREFDDDLGEEMRLHLELRREDAVRSGMAPDEANAAAKRQFGNATLLAEDSRAEWGWAWLEQATQDLRYAVRQMAAMPGFTATAVAVLALGIGANSAIYSVVNSVLLRPLAYKDPEQLVTILHRGVFPASPANYLDWQQQSRAFEAMAAAEYWSPNLTGTETPEKVWALRLTPNMLPMLGAKPLLGRVFAAGEDQPGADREVVLGYSIWQRDFAADRTIAGKTILLDGAPYTVIGVMGRDFQFAPFWATRAELWAPLALGPRAANRTANSLRLFARLKPGTTLAQARNDMAAVSRRLEREFPGTNREVVVTPLKQNVIGSVEMPLLVMSGAVGFLLLIACANVAHMLLARAASRQKEIALRLALGAGGTRLFRQFLMEGLLLGGMSAVAGLGFAAEAVKALVALGPAAIPRLAMVGIDWRVTVFCLGLAIATAVVFSLLPTLQARKWEPGAALKERSQSAGGGAGLPHTRNLLVASEIALAFILLIGAGLLVRSFVTLRSLDAGFNPSRVISMLVSVAGSAQDEPARRENFYRQLVADVQRLPGVESAGAINHLPLGGDLWVFPFQIRGRPEPKPGESPRGVYRLVMPGYFETMKIAIVRGRAIAEQDDATSPGSIVISERAARTYWPGEDPLGGRISFEAAGSGTRTWLTIVGIAKDVKQGDWAADPLPEVYLAALQNRSFLESPMSAYLTVVARTAANPAALTAAMKNAVWSLNRNLPISDVQTMEEVVTKATAQPRFEVILLLIFAAIAFALAAAGIYAVVSFSVSRRTKEIGIRMSLGATQTKITRAVLRQGLLLGLAGSAIGIAGALLLSRLMAGMLFGVRPSDPATFTVVALILNGAVVAASYLPARRAARIDPIIALRQDG
jgi:putative ABC transport system permease protein